MRAAAGVVARTAAMVGKSKAKLSWSTKAIPIAGFVLRERRLPWLWDLFPMYGGPWENSMTTNEFEASLGAFAALNAVVAAGGIVAFWIGYALPFPPVIALLRVTLVVVAWRGLRAR